MPRRREVPKREILPDPKFGNVELSKFMNVIMEGGKKAVAERIIYGALELIEKKHPDKDPLEAFTVAINNVKPMVEVKSRRVGGANYQVPVEVRPCASPGSVDALDQGSRPQAWRKVHGPTPGQRTARGH
jgi:small subunit ribosomal protein S7